MSSWLWQQESQPSTRFWKGKWNCGEDAGTAYPGVPLPEDSASSALFQPWTGFCFFFSCVFKRRFFTLITYLLWSGLEFEDSRQSHARNHPQKFRFPEAKVELPPLVSSLYSSVILPCRLPLCSVSDLGIFFFAFLSVFPLFRIPSSLRFRLPTQHQQLHSCPPCVFRILGNSHPWASGHPLGKQKVQYHVLHKPAEKKVPVFPSLRTNRKHAE